MPNYKTIYSGKMCLEKLIFYHEKEAWSGSFTSNVQKANFHNNAVKLLKQLQQELITKVDKDD